MEDQAVAIVIQTLKERCKNLQDRLTEVEKENVTLRCKHLQLDEAKEVSLTEVDKLQRKVSELTEQKTQLKNNVLMVASENRQLWARLAKLMQANKTMGSHLSKINDSLDQHNNTSSTLIRSKTFTQEQPNLKLTPRNPIDLQDKISLELEDISLKLINSIAKEKSELEMQCTQMAELQNSDVNIGSMSFNYLDDDTDDSIVEGFENHIKCLKSIRDVLLTNRNNIKENINDLSLVKGMNMQFLV